METFSRGFLFETQIFKDFSQSGINFYEGILDKLNLSGTFKSAIIFSECHWKNMVEKNGLRDMLFKFNEETTK